MKSIVFTCDEGQKMAVGYTGSLLQICVETAEYQEIYSFLRQPFLASILKCYLRNTKIIAITLSNVAMSLLLLLLISPFDQVVMPLKQGHVFFGTCIMT
jgi:hypothetical protein